MIPYLSNYVNKKRVYRRFLATYEGEPKNFTLKCEKLGLKAKQRKSKYKSHKGEVGKVADNLLKRNFNAEKPFEKLTTDVTVFFLCNEKVYLSPVMDLYNRELLPLSDEKEIVEELIKRYVYENAGTLQSQTEYLKKYNGYIQRYDTLKNKRTELLSLKESKLNQRDSLGRFMFTLMELDGLPIIFSDTLWTNTVETMTIFHDGDIVFKFKCGKEINV